MFYHDECRAVLKARTLFLITYTSSSVIQHERNIRSNCKILGNLFNLHQHWKQFQYVVYYQMVIPESYGL